MDHSPLLLKPDEHLSTGCEQEELNFCPTTRWVWVLELVFLRNLERDPAREIISPFLGTRCLSANAEVSCEGQASRLGSLCAASMVWCGSRRFHAEGVGAARLAALPWPPPFGLGQRQRAVHRVCHPALLWSRRINAAWPRAFRSLSLARFVFFTAGRRRVRAAERGLSKGDAPVWGPLDTPPVSQPVQVTPVFPACF